MSYEVSIVADSISPAGKRITTFQLKYPRIIHSEFLTHRAISRNASSTRAIPTAKMIQWIEQDPALPVYWGKNQKGMQATQELSEIERECCVKHWLMGRHDAIVHCMALMEAGVHKQIASRLLEPFAHINVVATATEWDNFFALRCHPAAMPEMQKLAVMMARAYRDGTPTPLKAGEWHLPYATAEEIDSIAFCRIGKDPAGSAFDRMRTVRKCSVARCARVSYKTFEDKEPDPWKDIELHDQLAEAGHWSPFEHQAMAEADGEVEWANFRGWYPYRQALPISVHKTFDFDTLDRFDDRDFIV